MSPWQETYQTKKGPRIRVRWYKGKSKKSRKAGQLKKTANKVERQVEDALVLRGRVAEEKTVSECMAEYLALRKNTGPASTHRIAEAALRPFGESFGSRVFGEVGTTEIEKFKNGLTPTRALAGINLIVRNVKTFYTHGINVGWTAANPCKGVKQFKAPEVARFLTREEMLRLYRSSSKPLRKALACFLYSGMRLGEFVGLNPASIGPNGITVMGKTGSRVIPLHPKIRRILPRQAGKWKRRTLESAFRIAKKWAGLGRIRLHDFRHTFASMYLKSGGTLADLMLIMGHSDIKTTQIYTHFQKDYLHERMGKVRL